MCMAPMILLATMNVLLPKCGATQEWSNDAKRNVRHVTEEERHARGKGRTVDWRNHILASVVSALHCSSIYSLTLRERHFTTCTCSVTGGERQFQEEGLPQIEQRWQRSSRVWMYTTSSVWNTTAAYAGQKISTCKL